MATLEDVRRLALALPEVSEGTSWGNVSWKVAGKMFVWERALRKTDLAQLGEQAPSGPLAGVRIAALEARESVLSEYPACFTIPHFANFPAVLIRLDDVDGPDLDDLITEAWFVQARRRIAKAYEQQLG